MRVPPAETLEHPGFYFFLRAVFCISSDTDI